MQWSRGPSGYVGSASVKGENQKTRVNTKLRMKNKAALIHVALVAGTNRCIWPADMHRETGVSSRVQPRKCSQKPVR